MRTFWRILLTGLIVASICACGIAQQKPKTGGGQSQGTYVHDYQACMRCKWAKGNTPGKCSNCGAQKVAIRGKAVHVCPTDQAVFPESQVQCATHKKPLEKRVLTYYCAKDKTSSSQSGNCTVCGKFRSKFLLMP